MTSEENALDCRFDTSSRLDVGWMSEPDDDVQGCPGIICRHPIEERPDGVKASMISVLFLYVDTEFILILPAHFLRV